MGYPRAMWLRHVIVGCAALACGGSVSNIDGGSDAPSDVQMNDVVGIDETFDVVPLPFDGVTGKACTSDADCKTANGPNVARCSNSVFAPEDYYPTAVCVLPSCPTVSDAQGLHYCDGPDNSASPGVCVNDGATGTICLPKCTYDQVGGAPVGCQGHDTCFAYTGAKEQGIGYCWGGCTKDADCQDGQKCQVDQGLCEKGVTPPTKGFGVACTKSDTNTGVCNCLYGTGNSGYCSTFCVVGGPACPSGAVCDSLEARAYGYTTPNTGMAGYCAQTCALDGGSCVSSSCTNVFASGPDCIPP
jgi:hypothetical protein